MICDLEEYKKNLRELDKSCIKSVRAFAAKYSIKLPADDQQALQKAKYAQPWD